MVKTLRWLVGTHTNAEWRDSDKHGDEEDDAGDDGGGWWRIYVQKREGEREGEGERERERENERDIN